MSSPIYYYVQKVHSHVSSALGCDGEAPPDLCVVFVLSWSVSDWIGLLIICSYNAQDAFTEYGSPMDPLWRPYGFPVGCLCIPYKFPVAP